MAKLKMCPFCNGKAEVIETFDEDGDRWQEVECQRCYARTTGWATEDEAIDAWNRREGNAGMDD